MTDDAFTLLVDEHYASLYRFALSLARNASDACDLTQQTFYIWATRGSALRDGAKAKSWLFTTLYREYLRTRRRDERHSSIEETPEDAEALVEPGPDLVARIDAGVLMDALSRIEEAFRVPLVLFYLEALSYREIAEALGVPVGTVMSRLSRAKGLLRAALAALKGAGEVLPFESEEGRKSMP